VINRLVETTQAAEVQETTFSIDVPGRHICSTWDEATANGGVAFDAVVIGAGMFGAYCAEKIYRTGSNLRVLVLDPGSLLVTEHVQNLARIGLNAAGPKQDPASQFDVPVVLNSDDPGTRERVWGIPMRSMVPISATFGGSKGHRTGRRRATAVAGSRYTCHRAELFVGVRQRADQQPSSVLPIRYPASRAARVVD
jgi:hypothetical protein